MTARRDAAIDALLDKAALYELAVRYARAVDRRDRDLLLSVYHAGAIDHHGEVFQGPAEAFAEAMPGIMARFELTAHYIINTSYRLDGDRAEGELYFIAYHRTPGPEPFHVTVGGRYLDRYERREGEWRIAHRSLVWDSVIETPVDPNAAGKLSELGDVGGFENDLSYRVLGLFGRGG